MGTCQLAQVRREIRPSGGELHATTGFTDFGLTDTGARLLHQMTFLPLVAALVWTAALITDPEPLGSARAMLTGISLLGMSSVSVVGMTVTGGRWAHRLGVGAMAACLIVAALRPIDWLWWGGLAMSVIGGSALFLPKVTSRLRRIPAAAGPPRAAVVAPIALLAAPFVLGILPKGTETWPVLVVGISAPIVALWFSRVIPGGLAAIRLLWPLGAIAFAPLLGLSAGIASAVLGLGVAVVAWRPEVKTAFHPPREIGTTHPIPPELTPGEILNAAKIDERGRPK